MLIFSHFSKNNSTNRSKLSNFKVLKCQNLPSTMSSVVNVINKIQSDLPIKIKILIKVIRE